MNILTNLGLLLIVLSLSAFAGNYYFITLAPAWPVSAYPGGISPGNSPREAYLLKSYEYRIIAEARGGEVRILVLELYDFLSQEGYSEKALLDEVVNGSRSLAFKPDRRGVYVLIYENPGNSTVSFAYTIIPNKEFEWDFFQDTVLVASTGGTLLLVGLLLEKASKWRNKPR